MVFLCVFFFPDESSPKNIWRQISQKSLDESLTPEYDKIEELFGQQTKKNVGEHATPKRKSTKKREVSMK